jgi:hypothetical protein
MSDVSVFLYNHPSVLKDFAGPVATIFAASVAAYIALRLSKGQLAIAKSQTEIARDKLKFDLFEMRYDIYTKVKELIEYTQSIHDYEKIDSTRVRALYVKLDEDRFFFDTRVIAFISEVQQTAEKRFGLLGDRWQADEQDEDQWAQLAEQFSGTDIALRELYAEAPAVFETALRFEQVSGILTPNRR